MDPDKPILIYDGNCGFCRRWIERWRDITGSAMDYASYQEAGSRFPGIARAEFEASVILIEPGKKIFRGAEAVFRSLAVTRSYRWLFWSYAHVPGVKYGAEISYRFISSHRAFFSTVSQILLGRDSPRG